MSLVVDWTRCDGHGLCALAAPELIALDEWGFPLITEAADGRAERAARRAAAVCPALALRLDAGPLRRQVTR